MFFCLIFLFFEAAFGICIGCKVYPLFNKDRVQHCPGEVCELRERQEVQKVSWGQKLVIAIFIILATAAGKLFSPTFSEKPYDLFGIDKPAAADEKVK